MMKTVTMHTQQGEDEAKGPSGGAGERRDRSMGKSLRCLLACVLPCGAFDLARVVHINGHVEEYSRQVSAREVLRANPNHVLTKPCSLGGGLHRIVLVSPDSDLKRGSIYFLIPDSSLPENSAEKNKKTIRKNSTGAATNDATTDGRGVPTPAGSPCHARVMPETSPSQRRRRRRRSNAQVGVWRPHLQSISEDP